MRDDFAGNLVYHTLHGGIVASMLDAAGGHAVWLKAIEQSKGQLLEKRAKRVAWIGSIDMRVNYLRPGKGEMFKATASILRMGNKVAVTRITLPNENDDWTSSILDILLPNRISSVTKEVQNGSVLHEMPKKNRDQEPEEDHYEEQETSDSGCVFQVWNKGV